MAFFLTPISLWWTSMSMNKNRLFPVLNSGTYNRNNLKELDIGYGSWWTFHVRQGSIKFKNKQYFLNLITLCHHERH